MELLNAAWETVYSEIISNYFGHAVHVKNNFEVVDFNHKDDIPLTELVEINNIIVLDKFKEYVKIDENEKLPDNYLV